MRLLELDIRAFRRFAGRVRVRPRPEGLTLLAGDNEEGKSSVLAALEAVLFEQHGVGGRVLDAMRPWTGGDPQIAARFLLDGREWRIEKRFGRSAGARLFEGARLVARDAEAERRLVELLQFEPRQGRAEPRPEHRGLIGLFWLQQGTSFHGFKVPAALRGTLLGAVAAEIDLAAGGGRLRAVLDFARERAQALLTSGRRQETGELREFAQARAKVREQAEELEQQWRTIEVKVAELEKLRDEARRVARRDELGEARRRLHELEARKAQLEKLAVEVERALAVAAQRRGELQDLERQIEARRHLRRQLEEAAREQAGLAEKHAAAARRLARDEAALAATTARQQEVACALTTIEGRIGALRRAAERARLRADLGRMKADRERLATLQARLVELGHALAAVRATPELVRELRRALTEQAAARAALEAVATRLEFRPEPGRRVLREGAEIPTDGSHLVTEPAEFVLEGFGRLGVRPGATDLAERRHRLTEVERQVARLLEETGVADLAEAEAVLRRRDERAAERQRIIDERRLLLERHQAGSEAELDARIGELAARLDDTPQEGEAGEGTAPEELLAQLEEEQRQRRAEAAALAPEAGRLADTVQNIRVELAGLDAVLGQADSRIIALGGELAALEEQLPEAELGRRLAAAREALERAEAEHAGLRREFERQGPEALGDELERQRRRVAALEAAERERRERIAGLEAELRAMGGSDLAERLERARGECVRLERAYAAKRREAEAWWLLLDRLEAAQRSRREALTRPVVERTLPWLRRLFPDASLEVDPEGLAIGTLEREGLREPFASLSVGTREQLAVLVRLALAELVAEARGDAPCLVLDDALVYADEHRFEVMKGILERAARERAMQILILTCRPRDWLGLEGELIRLEACGVEAA